MAGLQINPTDIAKARESGYSDKEIADFLSAKAPDQFKAAREAGYSDGEILSHLTGADNKPSGVIDGVREGFANVLHGPAETLKQFVGADTSGLEATSQRVAPKDYKPAQVIPEGGHWYDPTSYNWSQVPQAVAEAAPGMATDIAAAKLGARIHPLVGLGAGAASYLLRTRGDAAKSDAAIRTGNPDAVPETQDKVRSALTGAAEIVPQMIGLNRFIPGGALPKTGGQALAKAAITSAVEGGTGGAQNAISQAGATVGTDKGLTVDPNQVASAAVTSAATGGGLAVPKGLSEARAAAKYKQFYGDNEDATKAFTSRVNQALDGSGVNTKSSFNALRDADEGVRDELKQAIKPIKDTLDTDTAAALKKAGKGRTLTDSELQDVQDNTTPDIAHLARQAHVASLIKDLGDYGNGQFVGGMANAVGKHIRAIQNPAGAAASAALGAAGLGGHAASLFAYGPATLGAIAGGYAGMRGIDALTGNRTPLKGVIDRFSDPNAQARLPAPAAPAAPAPAPGAGPTGPQVPFSPGVAGGNALLATGQSPWTPRPQAPALDPAVLNEQVKGLLLMASARRKTAGHAQAEELAGDSPIINDNGGLATLANPAFGKRAQELLSAARAHAALTRQPEEEGQGPGAPAPTPGPAAPQAPLAPQPGPAPAPSPAGGPESPVGPTPAPVDPMAFAKLAAKITKANGKVKQEAPAEPAPDYTGDFVPLGDHELWGKGLSDKAFADRAKTEPGVKDPEAYADAVIRDRQKRRGILADLTGDADIEHQETAAHLLEQLHHARRGDAAAKAIKHYTDKLPPELRDAIRRRMDRSFINSMWSK
jgi:hypothetical protein